MWHDLINWLLGRPARSRMQPLWVKPLEIPKCCIKCPGMCLLAQQEQCPDVIAERTMKKVA